MTSRRWGWLSIFFTSSRTRNFSALFHNCMWQSRHPEVDVYLLTYFVCSHPTGRAVLTRSASTFSSVSLSLSERSTDKLVLSQPSKKRVSISWALERDVCSVTTGRPVLWIGFRFGWAGWLSSACRATSEPYSFIQSILEEIFGSGRGDSKTFSLIISPVSIFIAFGIHWVVSVL